MVQITASGKHCLAVGNGLDDRQRSSDSLSDEAMTSKPLPESTFENFCPQWILSICVSYHSIVVRYDGKLPLVYTIYAISRVPVVYRSTLLAMMPWLF